MSTGQWATVFGSLGWALFGLVLDEVIRLVIRLRKKEYREPRPATMLGVVVLLIAIASAMFSLSASMRTNDNTSKIKQFSACLYDVQQQNIDALNNIRDAGQARDDAFNKLIESFAASVGQPGSLPQVQADLAEFQRTSDELDQRRKDNPYVEPVLTCGSPPNP